MRVLWLALLLAGLCAPAAAQGAEALKVGDAAPEFGATRWVSQPERTTLAESLGDVILVRAWCMT